MSTITLIIVLGGLASLLASVLTVAAAMLSSRISQSENLTEQYEPIEDTPQLVPRSYSWNR